jgi:hypothetical protein
MSSEYDEKEAEREDVESDLHPWASQRRRPRLRLSAVLLSGAVLIFAIVSIIYVVVAVRRLSAPHATPRVGQSLQSGDPPEPTKKASVVTADTKLFECGDTVASAMSLGCPFDVMSNLWVPPHCHNVSYALESLQGVAVGTDGGGVGAPEFGLQEYKWFEDEELQQPIRSADELEKFLARRDLEDLPLEAYTQMSFHAAHCSYLARVATAGLDRLKNGETDVWIPEVATNVGHARHCEHVFGELFRLKDTGEQRKWTKVGFGISPCKRIG